MKEEKFEKVVKWSWLNDTGINFLFFMLFFSIGWIFGKKNDVGFLVLCNGLYALFILAICGLPKRKVYWRKIK